MTDITSALSEDSGKTWARHGRSGIAYNSVYHTLIDPKGIVYAAASSVHDPDQLTYLTNEEIDWGAGAIFRSTDGARRFSVFESAPAIPLSSSPKTGMAHAF